MQHPRHGTSSQKRFTHGNGAVMPSGPPAAAAKPCMAAFHWASSPGTRAANDHGAAGMSTLPPPHAIWYSEHGANARFGLFSHSVAIDGLAAKPIATL